MPRPRPLDDGAIDDLLRRGDDGALSAFVADARRAAQGAPAPSAALAAMLAGSISTDKGDLPATAASNVNGPASPAQAAGLPKWRNIRMKVKGFLAGLGIAGKLALGAGVAFAATTGAGAAGVLPTPAQHVFASTVDAVTPFSVPDGAGHGPKTDGDLADPVTTTTEKVEPTTSEPPAQDEVTTPTTGHHDAPPPATEPEHHETPSTTAPEQHDAPPVTEPEHHDSPSTTAPEQHDPTPTTEPEQHDTTSTTEPHNDNNNPESLSLECEKHHEGANNSVSCTWTASPNSAHVKYALLRGDGRVITQTEDGLSYTDTTVQPDVTYSYVVVSLDAASKVESHSNRVTIDCC
jgi:hypothetical protein